MRTCTRGSGYNYAPSFRGVRRPSNDLKDFGLCKRSGVLAAAPNRSALTTHPGLCDIDPFHPWDRDR